jgi:hypothetical protein
MRDGSNQPNASWGQDAFDGAVGEMLINLAKAV